MPPRTILILCLLSVLLCPRFARAHGFVGDRFFPPTIASDDPFATDELLLPSLTAINTPSGRTLDAGFEFDKEILPHLAIGIADDYMSTKPPAAHAQSGWDDVTLSLKYQLWQNDAHEAIISVGFETDLGGTGAAHAGAESFCTFTPVFYFGKGFGDLPDPVGGLRPFAVTGTIGEAFPASARDPNSLETGFALEYSLPYLEQQVKDTGLPHPFKDMIPLVEFTFQTGENRRQTGPTTGYIYPGVLYEAQYFQLGAEAIIPINQHTGLHAGVMIQLQIFIDDIFPKVFGHPLFGGQP